jgi:sulfide:quinone oxidoreductase
MQPKRINTNLSVSEQVSPEAVADIASAGFKSIICNRPDGEGADQPGFAEIETAAKAVGLQVAYQPVISGQVKDSDAAAFGELFASLPKPVFAYCRTGTRSATLWSLSEAAQGKPLPEILSATKAAGYDMGAVARRIANGGRTPTDVADATHTVVIIGGGAAGVSLAASLKSRQPELDIAIIDPAEIHYYQPGWTMVGGGIFDPATTAKTMASLIPPGVRWIKAAVAAFEPEKRAVILDGCRVVKYTALAVAPGLKLNWDGIEGLSETLGRNGVTSNYRYDLAPYTWECVQGLKAGRAVFTQPPMPIKCAGAPQQMRWCAAEGALSVGRSLAAQRPAQGYLDRLLQCRRGAVRRKGIRPRPDALHRALQGAVALSAHADPRRWAGAARLFHAHRCRWRQDHR